MHSTADWDLPSLEALTEGIKFLQTIAEREPLFRTLALEKISVTRPERLLQSADQY